MPQSERPLVVFALAEPFGSEELDGPFLFGVDLRHQGIDTAIWIPPPWRCCARGKAQQAATLLATGARDDRVFHVHPETLSAMFDRLVRQAGLPRIRFHDLRHTHVSLLAAAGVPPHVISARVGHATVGFTLTHYSHVLPGHQADAAALVARAVLGPHTVNG